MLPLSLLLRVKTVWLSNDDSIFFHRKWILDGCCKNLLQNLLLCLILWVSLVSEQKWHKNKSPCCKSNPVQLSEKRASAQISIKLHSHFRWPSAKAWKQSLAWLWINYSQFLQPVMFESNVESWIDWTSFGFLFKDVLSNLLLNTIIYWVIDQPF